jgi:MFS family permease
MSLSTLLPIATTFLALLFSAALFDQWRERRHTFQLVWALGMLFFGIAGGAEAVAALAGWSEPLYRAWYLTGAVWTAGWLGLGTCFLLARTRFGYAVAVSLFLAGLFTFLAARRPEYAGAGDLPILYFIGAGVLAAAVAVETYFQNERWPQVAALAVGGATVASLVTMLLIQLPQPGYALNEQTGIPTAEIVPGTLRLFTPFMNITGGLALILGAIFSAYVFMPKKRVLHYSLEAEQKGDELIFNLLIAPIAIVVNLVASIPGALRALVTRRIHSRVPATLLIALGATAATGTDVLARFGSTDLFQVGRFVAVALMFLGFLVSIETFAEIRVPFTRRVLRGSRHERTQATAGSSAAGAGTGKPA